MMTSMWRALRDGEDRSALVRKAYRGVMRGSGGDEQVKLMKPHTCILGDVQKHLAAAPGQAGAKRPGLPQQTPAAKKAK